MKKNYIYGLLIMLCVLLLTVMLKSDGSDTANESTTPSNSQEPTENANDGSQDPDAVYSPEPNATSKDPNCQADPEYYARNTPPTGASTDQMYRFLALERCYTTNVVDDVYSSKTDISAISGNTILNDTGVYASLVIQTEKYDLSKSYLVSDGEKISPSELSDFEKGYVIYEVEKGYF